MGGSIDALHAEAMRQIAIIVSSRGAVFFIMQCTKFLLDFDAMQHNSCHVRDGESGSESLRETGLIYYEQDLT